MESFRWGTFAEFLEASRFGHRGIELASGPAGSHLGRVDLREYGGRGRLEYFHSDTLRVAIFDCTFREDRVFSVMDVGWLRLNFALALTVDMALGTELQVRAACPSWRFICLPRNETAVESIPAGARLQWVTVCCRPELLSDWAGAHSPDLATGLSGAATHGDSPVHRDFRFTPLLRAATVDVLAARPQGPLRAAYVAAKAQELLVLGLEQMLSPAHPQPQRVRLTQRDVRALHALRALLDESPVHAPSIRALSRRAGINRNKLFYGFKRLFGVSISQHLQERRIEEGYRLLTTTTEPVGEIAARVGFRHQCNFSTAFRGRYGFAPSALRKPDRH